MLFNCFIHAPSLVFFLFKYSENTAHVGPSVPEVETSRDILTSFLYSGSGKVSSILFIEFFLYEDSSKTPFLHSIK